MLSQSELNTAKRSVLFRNVPDQMLQNLLGDSHKRKVARGATLFVQGDPATHMFVILEGCVKLIRITPGGEEIVVAVYSEGDSFGEAVALKGGQYPVTVEAVQDSVLLQVETRVVFDTLRSDPDLAVAMLSSTFSHLHELVMEIENLKALSGAQRLATFLISQVQLPPGARVLLAVGPERGWEEGGPDDELALLRRHGFELVTLGQRTLRTDVACVALLAVAHERLAAADRAATQS